MTLDLIIPTYNRSILAQRAINYVLAAERPEGLELRIILVDNNSTDDTYEKWEETRKITSFPVEYLHVSRPGKSAALNEAIAQSSADLIGLIDDDEAMDRDWFNVVYKWFSSDPELAYLGGQYLPDFQATPPKWLPKSFNAVIGIVRREKVARFGEFQGMLMGGNAIIRRDVLLKVMPYPENLGRIGNKLISGEDEVIYHRLLKLGVKGMCDPALIIYHWIPPERMTKTYYRRWAWGNGFAAAYRQKPDVPYLLGVPRYKFRNLFCNPLNFESQLLAIDALGHLSGQLHSRQTSPALPLAWEAER